MGLTGLAFYQAMRGNVVGPATENFWNAFGGLRILNNSLIAFAFLGLGVLQLTRGRWAGSASSLLFYAFVLRQLSQSNSGRSPATRTDDATAASGPGSQQMIGRVPKDIH